MIDYTSQQDFLNSLGNTGNTIDFINAKSPSSSAGLDGMQNAAAGGINYGLTPDEINQRYQSAYDQGAAKFDPWDGSATKNAINLVRNDYGKVAKEYDTTEAIGSMQDLRRQSLLTGQNAANLASQKYQESQIPGQNNRVGSSMVRAQSLLPFLQADAEGLVQEKTYASEARRSALTESTRIASLLANLEQNYTNSLADYNTKKATTALNYAGETAKNQLTASYQNTNSYLDYYKTQAQIAEQARQANLSAALKEREMGLSAAQTAKTQQIQAANAALQAKGPTGSWTTDRLGRITSGSGAYNDYQSWKSSQSNAINNLSLLQ